MPFLLNQYSRTIVKNKDEAAHGHYRTKPRILEALDAQEGKSISGGIA